MRTPESFSVRTQANLIALANPFQDAAQAGEIGDLPAHLRDLIGMQSDLTRLTARIIYIQNPLPMSFAASTAGAGDGRRMERVPFQE